VIVPGALIFGVCEERMLQQSKVLLNIGEWHQVAVTGWSQSLGELGQELAAVVPG